MKQTQNEIIQVFNFLIMAPMATNDVDNDEEVEVEKRQPLRCMNKGLMLSIINGLPITN
jgi:hypothetical protein